MLAGYIPHVFRLTEIDDIQAVTSNVGHCWSWFNHLFKDLTQINQCLTTAVGHARCVSNVSHVPKTNILGMMKTIGWGSLPHIYNDNKSGVMAAKMSSNWLFLWGYTLYFYGLSSVLTGITRAMWIINIGCFHSNKTEMNI